MLDMSEIANMHIGVCVRTVPTRPSGLLVTIKGMYLMSGVISVGYIEKRTSQMTSQWQSLPPGIRLGVRHRKQCVYTMFEITMNKALLLKTVDRLSMWHISFWARTNFVTLVCFRGCVRMYLDKVMRQSNTVFIRYSRSQWIERRNRLGIWHTSFWVWDNFLPRLASVGMGIYFAGVRIMFLNRPWAIKVLIEYS